MEGIMYQKLQENDVRHWWYRGRRAIIDSLITSKVKLPAHAAILDAGCGYGGNVPMLKKYGRVSAMDIDWEVIKNIDADEKIVASIPDTLKNKYDLILLTDVLEHIEDDVSASRWIQNTLKPGGYAILTVPALKILWSRMDDEVGHVRRYTKKTLLELFENNINVAYCSYYNFFLFPVKFLSKAQSVNHMTYEKLGLIGTIFLTVMKFEAFVLRFITFPIGIALILIIQNNKEYQ